MPTRTFRFALTPALLCALAGCGGGTDSLVTEFTPTSAAYQEVAFTPQTSEKVFLPVSGVDPKDYAGVVMLAIVRPDSGDLVGCTATRVSPNFYLTASHCYGGVGGAERPPFSGVFQGDVISICANGLADYPDKCYHSDYSLVVSNTQLTDIMLVHTPQPIDSTVNFVPIYSLSSTLALKNYAPIEFGGFGDTDSASSGVNDVGVFRLGRATQSTNPKDADSGDYAAVRDGKEFVFGLNRRESQACHGDSGGPVFYPGTRVVIGLQTHGTLDENMDCAYDGTNSYATRIDYWYDKVMTILSQQDGYSPPPVVVGANALTSDSAFKVFDPAMNYDVSMFVPAPIVEAPPPPPPPPTTTGTAF